MSTQTTSQLELAFDFVQTTREHIFLTGKAGTGKTTFLHEIKKQSLKRMIVVAPTGVAAINAGGVTIHSFFQMPFGPIIPEQGNSADRNNNGFRLQHRFSKAKIDIIRSLDLLVIDEISMVRADLLDGVDAVLRRFRRNQLPFGGIQLLMIGDMHQLAPVVKEDEWFLLKDHYSNSFFFSSHALQKTSYLTIELKTIFRQSDAAFISLLNDVRDGNPSDETIERLNSRYRRDAQNISDVIILTTHIHQARTINTARLNELPGHAFTFEATVHGDFPETSYPTEPELILKKGAKVMFIRNDSSGNREYYNGKSGIVTAISDSGISVRCPEDQYDIDVHTECWENMKYDIDETTKEIKERVIGEFHHLPVKAAWAITIHKSQGLTFDRVVIDARSAFAFGQVYVALSRCRSLDGVFLSTLIQRQCIKSDSDILAFSKESAESEPGKTELQKARIRYQKDLFEELFGYRNVERMLNYFRKTVNENTGSFSHDLPAGIMRLTDSFHKEIADVSDRFLKQLNELIDREGNAENNAFAIERISKASDYFHEKNEVLLLSCISQLAFETDNRELRKTINELLNGFTTHLKYKQACLVACRDGFRLHDYLQQRARASIQEDTKTPKALYDNKRLRTDLKHPLLYKSLTDWRENKSRESRKDPVKIIRSKLLEAISEILPTSASDLLKIKGFGPQKRKMYGHDILLVVIEYLKSQGMDYPETDTPGTRYKGNTDVPTDQLSYNMYLSGLTPLEIAEERGFALSTIEGHLSRFVEKGMLDARELVSADKFAQAYEYFRLHKNASSSDARSALGESFSYSELRMVLSQFKAEVKEVKNE